MNKIKMLYKNLKLSFQKTRQQQDQYSVWIFAVILAGALAFYWDSHDSNTDNGKTHEDPQAASTFIPAGFVLVPIEVANYESLDSILGKFGVVDLYRPNSDPAKRPIKAAERVKILRAPLNPSHFAVLVSEAESPLLVSFQGAFTVVVQNPQQNGTGFVNPMGSASRPKSDLRKNRITVESEYVQVP
jgi:hypothetical protein